MKLLTHHDDALFFILKFRVYEDLIELQFAELHAMQP